MLLRFRLYRLKASCLSFLLLAAGLLATSIPVLAHPLQGEPVIVTIYPQQTFLSVIVTGNIQGITVGCNITPAERIGDGFTKPAEQRVQKYINAHFTMALDGTPLSGTLTEFSYQAQMDPIKSRCHLSLHYDKPGVTSVIKPAPAPAKASIKPAPVNVSGPVAAATVKPAGKGVLTLTSTLFDYLPDSKTIVSINGLQKTLMHGEPVTIDPSALVVNLLHNLYDFMLLGINHIFIALSIIYIGAENIYANRGKGSGGGVMKHRFWIASSFGLVHGFGFSDTLREVGLPQQGLAWCLLAFNGGVEIAQVTICAICFPLLMLWRKDVDKRAKYGGMNWPTAIKACSVWVVFMGGYWLIQRTVG